MSTRVRAHNVGVRLLLVTVACLCMVGSLGMRHAMAGPLMDLIFGKEPSATYCVCVHNKGWQDWVGDGEEATKDDMRIEDLKVKIDNPPPGSVYYCVCTDDGEWSKEARNGDAVGTKGKSIECVKIALSGDLLVDYDIWYRVRTKTGWMDWAKNGQMAGTSGYGYNLLGIEARLQKKDEKAPGHTLNHFMEKLASQVAIDEVAGWWGSVGGMDGSGYYRTAIKIKGTRAEYFTYGEPNGSREIDYQRVDYLSNSLGAGWYFRDLGLFFPDKDKNTLMSCNADGSNYSATSSLGRLHDAPKLKVQ